MAGGGKTSSHPDPSASDLRSSPSNPSRCVGVTARQRAGEDGASVHPVHCHLETSVAGALLTVCEMRLLMPLRWVMGTLSERHFAVL